MEKEAVAPKATLGKRVLAFLLDAVFSVLCMFALYYTVGLYAINPAMGYSANLEVYQEYAISSGLISATYDSSGKVSTLSQYLYSQEGGYAFFEDKVWNYYTDFLTKHGDPVTVDGVSVPASEYYTASRCLTSIYGLDETGAGNDYYTYGENKNVKPVYKLDMSVTENQSKVLTYYIDSSSSSGVYVNAVKDLQTQSGLNDPYLALVKARSVSFAVSISIPTLIFFMLLPMLLPKGKTLGKLILHLGVANKEQKPAKKINIFLHYLIITLIFLILAIPYQVICWPIAGFLALADFIALSVTRQQLSLHDKISRTTVVDYKSPIKKKEEVGDKIIEIDSNDVKDEKPTTEVLDASVFEKARAEGDALTEFDETMPEKKKSVKKTKKAKSEPKEEAKSKK